MLIAVIVMFSLQAVEQWLNDQGLMENPDQSMFVTFGDWDLKTM